ncbi:MAG: PQQ-binding-like beta-propeller repeat protein [Bacteroidota bacterium]
MFKYLALNLLMLISCWSLVSAQTTVDFPKDVNLVKMTDPGVALVGTDDALYGIDQSGNTLWNNEKLRKVEAERVEVLSGSELVFVSDKGLLARNRVLNVLDGREYANTGMKGENIFGARVIHGTNQLWTIGDGKTIDVWDIAHNQKLYSLATPNKSAIALDKSASLTTTFSGMQPITYTGNKHAILHLALGHLGRYDLMSGEAQWLFNFKPYKPKGDKGDVASNPSNGFSVMKVDLETETLYFPFRDMLIAVDMNTGAAKWETKANRTGKVRDMYIVDEGILVLTYSGLQLIDNSTGAEKWKKPIKIKGADEGLLLEDEGNFYAVSKNNIVKIDLANRQSISLTEKIKFQGGDSFSGLEIYGDALVLSGRQNMVVVNKHSGKILNSVFYKKPGPGFLTIAQNIALASVAIAATMNSYHVNSINGNKTYYQYTPQMMSTRSGSSASDQHLYISTKFKDSDAQGFGVARVDKSNGQTSQKIVIGDREPIYDVDEFASLIFYKSDKRSIGIKSIQ